MGRHAAPEPRRAGAPRGQELLGWGAFCVPLAVVVLVWAGTTWPVAAAVGGLGAVAFLVLWLVARVDRGTAPTGGARGRDERAGA